MRRQHRPAAGQCVAAARFLRVEPARDDQVHGGAFYIEDRNSRNGVFINSPDNRLARTGAPVRSGDWILIEPYEIRVSVEEAARPGTAEPFTFDVSASVPAVQADPFLGGFGAAPQARDVAPGFGALDPVSADQSLDPLQALFGAPAPAPPPPGPKAEELNALPPWADPIQPPPVNPPPQRSSSDRAASNPARRLG
jgi:predicted component of type VI protein secretion system